MPGPDDPTLAGRSCPACGSSLTEDEGECPRCFATRTKADSGAPEPFTGPREIAGYRIIRELGSGGMGSVFEAFEERMNRHVALKILARRFAPSEKAGKRFEQEAWIAGRLDHPNLVKVYEAGTWEDLSFFSMELVSGGSLHDVIDNMRRWGRDDRWGLEFGTAEYMTWAVGQVIEAARALDYAHRNGVVHRDVKPMNLLLNLEPRAIKVADFGLAFEEDATRMTTEGKMLGTLAYMAPEQILGKRDMIDARTDVYALGSTLFELVTLELPFTGVTQELYLNNVLTAEARPPKKLNRRVSSDLETVMRKALEKSPEDRYRSAAAFADDLDNVLHLRPIAARAPSRLAQAVKWVRRKPVHAALLASLFVAVPAIAVLGYNTYERRQLANEQLVESMLAEGTWLTERDRIDEALETFDRVLELDGDNVYALKDRAMVLLKQFDRGRRAGQTGDSPETLQIRDDALSTIDRVVAMQPGVAWPRVTRAYMLQEMGLAERAEQERIAAAELVTEQQTDDELRFGGELALYSGRHEDALDAFSELYRRHPDWSHVIALRGRVYDDMGRADAAIAEYRLALTANPELEMTMLDVGRLETERGNLDDGEAWIRESLKVASRKAPAIAYEVLSYNLAEQGYQAAAAGRAADALSRFQQAESAARASLELRPDGRFAQGNLGASLMEQYRLSDEPDRALAEEAVRRFDSVVVQLAGVEGGVDSDALINARVNRCDALIQLEQLQRALEACFEVTAQVPDDAVGFYNLAGVFALLGRKEDALAALERDLALGDTDWAYLAEDPWFEGLREDPAFVDLLNRMRDAAQD